MNAKRVWIGVGVAAGLSAAFFLGRSGPPQLVQQFAAAASSSAGPAKVTPETRSTRSGDESRPAPSRALRQELAAATDWRAFALRAMERPSEGGYFYARYAARRCFVDLPKVEQSNRRSVAETIAKTGTVSQEQLDAGDFYARHCGSFVHTEASDLIAAVNAKAADGRDPLMNAIKGVDDALALGDSKVLAARVQTLLSTRDDVVIDGRTLRRVMNSEQQVKAAGGYWFAGNTFLPNRDDSYGIFGLAVDLAQCGSELMCDFGEQMAISCFSGATCAKSPVEYVEARYVASGNLTQEQFSKVIALKDQLRAAIEAANVRSFVKF